MPTSPEPKAYIVLQQPSKEVQQFLRRNPHAKWTDCLRYVLNEWPQVVDGEVNYLIEGGTAIKLMFPQRREPKDVDILTRSIDMETAFQGSSRFDVKYLPHWYAFRLPPYNMRTFEPNPGSFLMGMHESVNFEGKVFTLSKLALAVSKTLRFCTRGPRDKDLSDLILLDQDPKEIQTVIDRIITVYPQSQEQK